MRNKYLNMKAITLALILAATAALAGCKSQAAIAERRADVSWSAFCTARGYAIDDNTYQATNEYLDTWCGSTEEEAALRAAGINNY